MKSISPVWILAWREIKDQFRDWRVIFPILGLTLFFPFLMNFTATQILDFVAEYGAVIIGERMVPFLMMIVGFFPISVSLVVALESFVGEKERGSIEPLLITPIEDWQLYLGKMISSVVPPLLSSYLGMGVYLAGLFLGNIAFPETDYLFLIFSLTTFQAVMMVAGAVVVSSQATSVRGANLLASFIIIPVALLIQGESLIMFWGDISTLWWIVFGIVILTVILIRVGVAHFQREELLGREIDVLNIRWGWKLFTSSFAAKASSIRDWYRLLFKLLREKYIYPIALAVIFIVAGFIVGMQQTDTFFLPLNDLNIEIFTESFSNLPIFSLQPVAAIWWQNIRALIVAFLLGLLTLGVLGSLPLLLTSALAGFLLNLMVLNGFSVFTFLIFIVPHGIVEFPAAILATAGILRIGGLVIKPDYERTIGEIFIGGIADWFRIMVGLGIPLLILASMIEVWITPLLVQLLVH